MTRSGFQAGWVAPYWERIGLQLEVLLRAGHFLSVKGIPAYRLVVSPGWQPVSRLLSLGASVTGGDGGQ